MKIIFTTHVFLPGSSGGTEVYTNSLAQEMKQRGHEVLVLCVDSMGYGNDGDIHYIRDEYEGIPVHRLQLNIMYMENPVRAEYYNEKVEEHLQEVYKDFNPDIIQIVHCGHLSTAVITAADKLQIPMVSVATDFWYVCPKSQLLKYNQQLCKGPQNLAECLRCYTGNSKRVRLYQKLISLLPDSVLNPVIKLCRLPAAEILWQTKIVKALGERPLWMKNVLNKINVLITPTRFLRDVFIHNGIEEKRLKLIPYGLKLDWNDIVFDQDKVPNKPIRFAFIGAIASHKGPEILIKAFNKIKDKDTASLQIYGDPKHFPDYYNSLVELAKGNDNISFMGTFPNSQIGEVLANIDVLVVPSIWYENTPLVIYSAFAANTPVIATDLGGMSDVVKNQVNGYLFEAGNINQLTGIMQEIINKPEVVKDLQKGITRPKTIEKNVDELLEIYSELLS